MKRKIDCKIKRKYKHLAAAFAGAAILSSVTLPGMSSATAHASDKEPVANPSPTVTQTQPLSPTIQTLPVTTEEPAIAQHEHNNVQTQDKMRQPREFRDVNNQSVSPLVAPRTISADQKVIYKNAVYDTWLWDGSAYSKDMALGVFLQNPLKGGVATTIPSDELSPLVNVDFNHQFVIYAHLEIVGAHGYGIGIGNIVQEGNDLIVTVRFTSPQSTTSISKPADYVLIDRSAFKNSLPINVTFVNQNGVVLNTYRINPS